MKKTREANVGFGALTAAMTLVLMLMLGLFVDGFSLVSHAESQGKVVADSANIRKSPSASSDIIGSTEKDKSISIKSQTKGSDDKIWYQVFVDANTLGYIRSDLVSITDGTTPPTDNTAPASEPAEQKPAEQTPAAPPVQEPPADVEAVEPVSATVAGSGSVRVRANASTNSQIVTTAKEGLTVTVTGRATGNDNKEWYRVSFIADSKEITGFIRSDYVELSEEIRPEAPEEPEEPAEDPAPVEPEAPIQSKEWDTQKQDGEWYLINNMEARQYAIDKIFEGVKTNAALYEDAAKKIKRQTGAIVVLVILLVLVSAALAYLIFKMKDARDASYFSEVEKETLRRKGERLQGGSGQRVMHTVGAERQGARPQGGRPQGARPAGAPQGAPQGQRPQGARPAGAPQGAPQGQRPQGARPAGAPQGAPVSQRPQGARPAGAPQGAPQGQRPQGARPAGAPQGAPVSQRPQGARPAGAPQGAPASARPQGEIPQTPNPAWKSKNFMAEDDEFEFEFLNWDGEDEQ